MRISALLWFGLNLGLSTAIQEAEPGQFPYTVSLQVSEFELVLSIERQIFALK